MASLTLWTWVSVDSGAWWWTGRPGVLWFMELQRVGHDWVTELNWAEWENIPCKQSYRFNTLEESLEISFNTPNPQKRELRFKVIFKGSLRFKGPYGQRFILLQVNGKTLGAQDVHLPSLEIFHCKITSSFSVYFTFCIVCFCSQYQYYFQTENNSK